MRNFIDGYGRMSILGMKKKTQWILIL
jgi:hypothetical protein